MNILSTLYMVIYFGICNSNAHAVSADKSDQYRMQIRDCCLPDTLPKLNVVPAHQIRQQKADRMVAKYLLLCRFDDLDSSGQLSYEMMDQWKSLFAPNAEVYNDLGEQSEMIYFEDYSTKIREMYIDSSFIRRTDLNSRVRDNNRRIWVTDKSAYEAYNHHYYYVIEKEYYYRSSKKKKEIGPRKIKLQLHFQMNEYATRCMIVEIKPYLPAGYDQKQTSNSPPKVSNEIKLHSSKIK